MEFIKKYYDSYEGEVVNIISPSYNELIEAYAKARLYELGENITKDNVKHMMLLIAFELEERGYDLDIEDIAPIYDLVLSYLED